MREEKGKKGVKEGDDGGWGRRAAAVEGRERIGIKTLGSSQLEREALVRERNKIKALPNFGWEMPLSLCTVHANNFSEPIINTSRIH